MNRATWKGRIPMLTASDRAARHVAGWHRNKPDPQCLLCRWAAQKATAP